MNDGASRNANYYDLDDIVIEEELVPVVFHKSANGVKVDPSAEKDFVGRRSEGRAAILACSGVIFEASCINKCSGMFQPKHIEGIELNFHFHVLGRNKGCGQFLCQKINMVGDRTIGKMLLSTFQMRYKDILTKAHTVAYAMASKFLTVLTKEETNLCEAAQHSMATFKKWRIGGPRFQRASVLGRKRKPIE
ncbi:hypothetical protein Patl1_06610 [Pistacia atlantica]|uniref:Uncharacterized protein n=1 Tax=Pistacia atlantica TaxID=434234 RepID=A0ACC1BQU3_9ROSI|nr:hypothetical protein Patl1_06610 [Pistacia atlantica]